MSAKLTRSEGIGRNGFGSLRHIEGSTTRISGGGLTVHAEYSGSELFLTITDEEPAARGNVILRLSRFTGRVETTTQHDDELDDLTHSVVSDTKIDGGGLVVRVEYSRDKAFILVIDEEAPSDRHNTIVSLDRNTGAVDWNSGRTWVAADKWRGR
ncbi:hypothetical protein AB0F85_07220 [Nocardia fluminea]|uniref:hypothetical protein n=1 Tax=Nocardia fluminea TaxID=134984 RepID=UPI0033FA9895